MHMSKRRHLGARDTGKIAVMGLSERNGEARTMVIDGTKRKMLHGEINKHVELGSFRYLDEQTFRFNTRKGTDADRFVKAAVALTGKRLTYDELIGKGGEVETDN